MQKIDVFVDIRWIIAEYCDSAHEKSPKLMLGALKMAATCRGHYLVYEPKLRSGWKYSDVLRSPHHNFTSCIGGPDKESR